jgi:hypothetical protein
MAGREGFISNALLLYKSRQKAGDHQNEMGSKNYGRRLKTMLILNSPPNSILVIDNASQHNVQTDHLLTRNSERMKLKPDYWKQPG